MKNKNQNFKFNKKSPKSIKISKNCIDDKDYNDYSKIICEVLEKNKEESKNLKLNNVNNPINFNNSIKRNQISNKQPKNIIKVELNSSKKCSKNKLKEESIKDKNFKLYRNIHNKNSKTLKNKNIFQSNSEKNITKEIINEDRIKGNTCINKINNSNINATSLTKHKKININLTTVNDSYLFRKQKSYNNKKEEKFTERKIKKIEELKDKAMNIQYNKDEIFGNKNSHKPSKQLSQNNLNLKELKSNSNLKNQKKIFNKKINNKKLNINENINNSPDKIIIKINNAGNHNIGKNKNFQKKIIKNNTGMNSNNKEKEKSRLLKRKKYMIHNNTDNSPNSLIMRSSKISSKKEYVINIKNNNNSSKNSSNSKSNYLGNQNSNMKGVKVESINIDLNIKNQKYKNNSNSPKIERDTSLKEKNNLMELNCNGPNESIELNHSFKTAFSLSKKTRSLSKKRDERKKMNLFKFDGINEKENNKKLNDILMNLSHQQENEFIYRNIGQRSEPKKLIDKIRKVKKMKKINNDK